MDAQQQNQQPKSESKEKRGYAGKKMERGSSVYGCESQWKASPSYIRSLQSLVIYSPV